MMMKAKMKGDMDSDILDELISMCEDRMTMPLKKKKEMVIAKVDADDEGEDYESEDGEEIDDMEMLASEGEGESEESDLDGMDLEQLVEMYKKLQA